MIAKFPSKRAATGIASAVLVGFGLTACSCRATLHVRGSTRGSVTFVVESSRGMTDVVVEERDFSGGWNRAWELHGTAGQRDTPGEREIVYGQAPATFTVKTAPTRLHPHGIYHVEIGTQQPFLGAPCSGGVTFTFTPGGEVKECLDVEACRKITGG